MKKDKCEDLLNKAMELEDLLINAKEGKWLSTEAKAVEEILLEMSLKV